MLLQLFVLSFVAVTVVVSTTKVTVYENGNYGGGAVVLDDLDAVSYYYFTSFDNKLTSFKINYGSCVKMFDSNPPGDDWFWAKNDISNVGSEWNDRVSTVQACGSYSKTIQCPSGTFVKTIEWGSNDYMSGGIKLHCNLPNSKTATEILYTHSNGNSLENKKECSGLRGIAYSRNHNLDVDEGLTPVCRPEGSGENTIVCGDNEAVSGMTVSIENLSGYIKSSALFCNDVGDISIICAPYDKKNDLFTCDATEAVGPLKCRYAKKVGYGKSSVLSESQSNEYIFYSELGFNMGYAGYGLSINFETKVGESNRTGYNWTKSQETTWTEEITMEVEIEAPPGCKTTVSEILGECSFISVRPYYFIRTDICDDKQFVTEEFIPKDIIGKIYTSYIPKHLSNRSFQSQAVAVPLLYKENKKSVSYESPLVHKLFKNVH